jgi:hypothetical protein
MTLTRDVQYKKKPEENNFPFFNQASDSQRYLTMKLPMLAPMVSTTPLQSNVIIAPIYFV